jgi:hypothetical protein
MNDEHFHPLKSPVEVTSGRAWRPDAEPPAVTLAADARSYRDVRFEA